MWFCKHDEWPSHCADCREAERSRDGSNVSTLDVSRRYELVRDLALELFADMLDPQGYAPHKSSIDITIHIHGATEDAMRAIEALGSGEKVTEGPTPYHAADSHPNDLGGVAGWRNL